MAKKSIYVIGYGIDPDTKEPVINKQFSNWDDCKPYIENVKDAKYKGFYTQEEADAWKQQICQNIFGNGGGKPPVKGVATGYGGGNTNPLQPNVTVKIGDSFMDTCKEKGYDPDKVMYALKSVFVYAMNSLKNVSLDEEDEIPFH